MTLVAAVWEVPVRLLGAMVTVVISSALPGSVTAVTLTVTGVLQRCAMVESKSTEVRETVATVPSAEVILSVCVCPDGGGNAKLTLTALDSANDIIIDSLSDIAEQLFEQEDATGVSTMDWTS